MKIKTSLAITTAMALGAVSQIGAQVVNVFPDDINPGPVNLLNPPQPGWNITQTSSTGSIGISGNQPRSGNGSLALHGEGGESHWEMSYYEGIQSGGFLGLSRTGTSMGLVADLDTVSIDWMYIDNVAPSVPAAPVVKLLLWDGQNPGPLSTFNTTYLTWEGAYNNVNKGNHAEGVWHTTNILDGNFWEQGNHNTGPYDEQIADFANYHLVGLRTGFGSGWNGETEIYVDNFTFGFSGEAATTFNFEMFPDDGITPVPEPSTYGVIGAALLLGLIGARRLKARKS